MANQFIVTLIVLGFLGIIDAIYLMWKNRKKQPLVCPIGQDCNAVVNSKYSKIFFVRNEVLGALFYIFVIVSGFLLFSERDGIIMNLLLIGSGFSVLFSGFLVFIQAKVLRNYCFYCLISALINVLIFLNVLVL